MEDISFSETDYVGLPSELTGKSPQEIATYYENKGRQDLAAAETSRTVTLVGSPLSTADFFKAPVESTKKVVQEEVVRALSSAQGTAVESAKIVAASKHSDWVRFEPKVSAIMKTLPIGSQMDWSMWEAAYVQVKGAMADELATEAEERGRRAGAGIVGAEVPTGGVSAGGGGTPTPLPAGAAHVIERLGITEAGYRKATERIEAGTWPLTMSNTRRPA